MKRITIFTLLVFSFIGAFAQNISVADFKLRESDMTAASLEGRRKDQNGDWAALIRIETTETGFVFEAGALGIVDTKQETGEVWVWVPRASRKITIKHPKLGVLYDFRYPIEIEAERTYWMKLVTGKTKFIVEEDVREQYLVFQISPADAMLEVDDQVWPVSAEGTARRLMNFGTYTYRVQALNYHADAGQVTVDDPDNAKTVQINLRPNFGWIEVNGDGNLKGAAVYIDNTLAGKAPFKSENLKSGKHTVKIVREMYEPYSTTVTVNDNETTQVKPQLTADFAHVTLQVDADAEIWVNDERKGVRTWTGDLANGTYKMECRQANHETSVTRMEITSRRDGEVIRLEPPTPIYGSLAVECTPDMATLFIDGKEEGKAPKLIGKILIGTHELKLTKDGYADYVETVTIAKGQRTQVNATLSRGNKAEETFTVNGVSFTMKLVEGGTFQMGATSELGLDAEFDEKPVHSITLNNYYIGETEVTQALWKAVMSSEPNGAWENKNGKGDNYPAYRVSWNDVQEFIRKLNQITGKNFRLPTEAEWEYAARGGKKSKGYRYAGSNTVGEVAWCSCPIHTVKAKIANELGLYDMSGNVYEWCTDWYGSDYYGKSTLTNPQGPLSGSRRVLRGGSCNPIAKSCRVSERDYVEPDNRRYDFGFRLALSQ